MKYLATILLLACPTLCFAQGKVKSGEGPPTPQPATIELLVPHDAKVYLDGKLTQSTGSVRRYTTPPLLSGVYEVKVGGAVKHVRVYAGETSLAVFEGVGREASPFAEQPTADDEKPSASWPRTPKGEKYVRAKYTQEIAVTNGRDRITAVSRESIAGWTRVSGGMEGVAGFRSDVFRHTPKSAEPYIANLGVLNSFGYIQSNRGWSRDYPDGSRFDDVLTNTLTGKVFEHRVAHKDKGVWTRKVIFADVEQRPAGYNGLKQSCSSCHDQAGTGGYAQGMIPGSDTVFSDGFAALEQ